MGSTGWSGVPLTLDEGQVVCAPLIRTSASRCSPRHVERPRQLLVAQSRPEGVRRKAPLHPLRSTQGRPSNGSHQGSGRRRSSLSQSAADQFAQRFPSVMAMGLDGPSEVHVNRTSSPSFRHAKNADQTSSRAHVASNRSPQEFQVEDLTSTRDVHAGRRLDRGQAEGSPATSRGIREPARMLALARTGSFLITNLRSTAVPRRLRLHRVGPG